MTVESAQLAFFQTLTGQQQMHVQRTSEPPDSHEQFREFRLLTEQFRELVDHHEQSGQRCQSSSRCARLLVVGHIGEVSGRAQQLLPTVHLAGEGITHPVDQSQVLGQVGDHGRNVRRGLEPREGRPALEVDQHQVQLLRGVGGHQPENERTQKLRLTRTRCADAQSVWTHAVLGRLLQIDLDRAAVGCDADGYPQPVSTATHCPRSIRIERTDIGDSDEAVPSRHCGPVVGDGIDSGGRRRRAIRRKASSNGVCLGGAHRVRHGEDLDCRAADRTDRAVLDHQLEPATCRQSRAQPGQVDDGDGIEAGVGEVGRTVGDQSAVHHDHQLRDPTVHRPTCEAIPHRQDVPQRALELEDTAEDHSRRTGTVSQHVVLCVRQPLGPFPLLHGVGAADDGHREVVRSVKGTEIGDHRAHHRTSGIAIPGYRQSGESPQRHGNRQLGHHRVCSHESAQRHRGHRFQLFHRSGLGRHESGRQTLIAEPDPHVREVGVLRPTFPHTVRSGRRPQSARIRVAPLECPALISLGVGDVSSKLVKIPQIVLTVLVRLGGTCSPGLAPAGQHAHHRHQHHGWEHQHHRVRCRTGSEHERNHSDHGGDHHQRHQLHQEIAGYRARHGRRRLKYDLAAR
ncbi:hypothetical protein RhoFasGS6_05120 [Rhodococcus fascians]|nr:hypothetical protein [Rhodococcus fascians]